MTGIRHRRSARSRGAALVSVALVATLAACGTDDSDGADTSSAGSGSCADVKGPIKIGNISPLSGPAASLGKLNNDAARIAIEVFNKQDDICGQKIENVASDDKGDPATALNLGRKYVADGIGLMMNIGMSETEDALAPYLQKEGVVVVGSSAKGNLLDSKKNPSYFSIYPNIQQYAQGVVDQVKAQGWDKVGTLSDGTAFGKEFSAALLSAFEKAGITVTKSASYSPTAIDLSTPVQQIRASGAEVLVPAGATGIPALVSAVKQSGWQPHMISWGAFITYATKAADLPRGTLDGCQVSLPADEAPGGTGGLPEGTIALLEEAEQQLGKESFGVHQSTALYSQLLVFKAAIEKAGSTEPDRVLAALKTLENVETPFPDVKLTFAGGENTGFPDGVFSFCRVDLGPFGLRYKADNLK